MSIVELSRDATQGASNPAPEKAAEPILLKFPTGERVPMPAEDTASTAARIAIVLPSWIGDVVMATPALRALREHFGPRAHLVGLARSYVASVLEGTTWLDETLLYVPRSADRSQQTRAIAGQLRERRIDTILVMNRSLHSCLLANLSGARRRVGYGGRLHRLLLRGERTAPLEGEHHSPLDCYLNLTSTVTGRLHEKRIELATTGDDELAADLVWRRFGLNAASQVVALNGGSGMGDSRNWPLESFAALARKLVQKSDCSVLVMCGPQEQNAAAKIAALAKHPRVHSMAEQDLSLGTAKACLRRTDLLVSTDSGPRHIAAAFGVPIVSLMGPMGDHLSRNYHTRDLLLRADVGCAPCGQHTCPLLHQRCMRDLGVERVLAAALGQLQPAVPRRLAA